jgi:dTMP kinase
VVVVPSIVTGMEGRGNPTPGVFSLIRHGPFSRLWWAGLASSFGDWVALFATIALADSIGGVTGILVPLTARMLPGLFGAAAGVLADRFNRKVTMVICDVGRAALAVSLVFVRSLPQLFLVSFVMEVFTLFWGPSREASVPNLVPKTVLVRANSLSLMAVYGTLPLGSAVFSILAGITEWTHALGVFGSNTGLAFIVDAVTFLMSASLIWTIAIPPPEVSKERQGEGGLDWRLPFRDIMEGIRFILRERTVRSVIAGIATALFGAGIFFALGQPFSSDVLGAGSSGFGFLVTALGTGVGLGMIGLSITAGSDLRREVVFGASLLATGLTITAAALSHTVAGAAFWALLAGLGAGSSYVMGFTHLHESVSDELRGRTFAALYTLARTALLISISAAAVLAAALDGVLPGIFRSGIRSSLVFGGAVVAFAGAITLWNMRTRFGSLALTDKALRSLDDASGTVSSIRQRKDEEE